MAGKSMTANTHGLALEINMNRGQQFLALGCVVALSLPVSSANRGSVVGDEAYSVSAAAPEGFDRTTTAEKTLALLHTYIATNTENPPGNELVLAQIIARELIDLPGMDLKVLDAGEGRGNLVARLRAPNPTEAPVLVMAHMDVVGAQLDKWAMPPFEATLTDGYVYGRGVIDDKGMLAVITTVMQELAKHRASMKRDVILLATAGEEGGPSVGIDWVLEHHNDLIGDAEFALNEGGRIRVRDGRIVSVNIQTSEKVPYNVVGKSVGQSGHGSVPLPNNALATMSRAVARIHDWKAPVLLNPTTRIYFERLATIEPDQKMADAMRALVAAKTPAGIEAAAAILSMEPLHNAVLRTGLSLTLLNGGIRTNVIPSEGTATFNVRVLPGDDLMGVIDEMRRVGAEESVTWELDGELRTDPPVSPVETALFQSMSDAALEMVPDVVVLPFMSTGATDGAALRRVGIPTYGILPLPLEMGDELRMHGDEERAPVASIGWATEYIYRVLAGVAL
ncbi:MAG: acetylornithine deacetylase/succinyl-diaminopimelate desuccinylase-like protein [Planctomycetota bacterium]|jgi:acetylornithine deacetylase/succinyl-diaminopimelate desuccinylase-like protein